ncbi:hypothetical protein YC2023_054883 [Brassica napus]|uniref:Uncharacterized protein n=3 Tax=Brassica TaxID=3705 RepID=A0A0D3C337_BRAOL|nr:unnamed protein product [Brassica oleracea]
MKSLNEPKRSFWGSLASKAKALLDHDPQSPTTRLEDHNVPSSATKEGITAVENRTAGIIQETHFIILNNLPQQFAMAMAAKAKLLLRELKMVKSDLAEVYPVYVTSLSSSSSSNPQVLEFK